MPTFTGKLTDIVKEKKISVVSFDGWACGMLGCVKVNLVHLIEASPINSVQSILKQWVYFRH